MKRFRHLVGQSPAIAISITALIFSLAGGATAATVMAPSAGLTWHRLTLINGWVSSESAYGTGNPSYAVSNHIVYLAGSLHDTTAGSEIFARLPRSARPKHNLYISIYANAQNIGTLYVEASNGQLWAYSPTTSEARLFASLAGVSFPVGS